MGRPRAGAVKIAPSVGARPLAIPAPPNSYPAVTDGWVAPNADSPPERFPPVTPPNTVGGLTGSTGETGAWLFSTLSGATAASARVNRGSAEKAGVATKPSARASAMAERVFGIYKIVLLNIGGTNRSPTARHGRNFGGFYHLRHATRISAPAASTPSCPRKPRKTPLRNTARRRFTKIYISSAAQQISGHKQLRRLENSGHPVNELTIGETILEDI